jgi:hypothetical protein
MELGRVMDQADRLRGANGAQRNEHPSQSGGSAFLCSLTRHLLI